MPTESASPPQPKLHEPYDEHSYSDLRHELTVRRIRFPRGGSRYLCNRAGFIKLLREWDSGGSKTETTRRTSPRRVAPPKNPATQTKNQMTSTRTIRARRGCRFRLINVLISAAFRSRWGEMVSRGGNTEVNKFWMDVHAAFMEHNEALDTLHFQDALFVNVTPNVILAHSAARLLQMWNEIVAMYRNAVAQAKDAAAHNDNVHSFFDFCAGRLDLLYLQMAMLLEPKLYEFIVSDQLQAAEPFRKSKVKNATSNAESKQAGEDKSVSATTKPEGKTKPTAALPSSTVAEAAVKPSTTSVKLSGIILQNPEMKESSTLVGAKTTTTASPKTTAVKTSKSTAKASQSKPTSNAQKAGVQKKTLKSTGKGKATTTAVVSKEVKAKTVDTASSANEPKPKSTSSIAPAKESKSKVASTDASGKESKAKPSPSKPKAAVKAVRKRSPACDKPVQMTSHGKRRREEEDTAIVEIPSVSDIVPHPGKRVHTTTTISTALATRPADMMLPPDEWDILESRLRKVNENIDRCHRGLSSVEGNVSDTYKQSLEADLRFYSAIKQRLQEQLLVVMQSGY
ncbi:hypothetical protein P3T76_012659 [Phytophthora citrophthora]|uniref:Uncharacterized protein n=1 Tax=Phytophthora citrophthora TaxID=4793 RepID=A0AAD9G497_9STRA|nr:hypothetical protein P3T76_012659 [Phytophthora citrophthora]